MDGDAGVYLNNVNNCNISNNILENNSIGIQLSDSNDNTILNNSVIFNNEVGLLLDDSYNNSIINNYLYDNDWGIGIQDSINATLIGNIMENNGISIWGDSLEYWNTHFIDTSNKVNGKPVYYWRNKNGGKNTRGCWASNTCKLYKC